MKENERIKAFRDSQNITQQDLANILGVSKQYLSKVESGGTELSKDRIKMISDKFGVSTDWLLFERGNMYIHENEKLDSMSENPDTFGGIIIYTKIYSCYINAASKVIKEKYKNAILDDIINATQKLFIDDIVQNKALPSKAPKSDVLIKELIDDKTFNENIISKYCLAYVNRCEKQ